MKWKDRGHEFDALAKEYGKRFPEKQIFIFGAGEMGARYAKLFLYFDKLRGFIDNSKEKQKSTCCGREVLSLEKYLEIADGSTVIVVCVNARHNEEVVAQLLEKGLEEGKDFIGHEEYIQEIFPVLLMYRRNKVLLPLVQISLTERCTLKCKKCAHACHLVPANAADLPIKEVFRSADMLFSFVEYVQEFVLIGGEPFLYMGIEEAISYIGKKYRDRMNVFSITTNGTITPSDNILELCKKHDVLVRISNYAKTLPRLEHQHEKLVAALRRHEVSYVLGNKDNDWMDYGFEYVDRKGVPEQLEKVFDECHTPCHEARGDRFYFCVMARSVAENMHKEVGKQDYLNMTELRPGIDNKIFFEYMMGYSEKGYLDMCNYCHGAETKKYPVPAAEQTAYG